MWPMAPGAPPKGPGSSPSLAEPPQSPPHVALLVVPAQTGQGTEQAAMAIPSGRWDGLRVEDAVLGAATAPPRPAFLCQERGDVLPCSR